MDIDIDFQTKFNPVDVFSQAIPASMVKNGLLVKHPCGHYFQEIPVDSNTRLAAIPYDKAEDYGYFKIDFLHLSLLDHFENKSQIRKLLRKQPKWELLQDEQHVVKLFQLHRHAAMLSRIKPSSVQELADCIALIRPGKKHLINDYVRNKQRTRTELYLPDEQGYSFKRSHAISYALTIVLQLHLIEQGIL